MTVGKIIDELISIKHRNRSRLTQSDVDAINYACNILEKNFSLRDSADDLVYSDKRGEQNDAAYYFQRISNEAKPYHL